MNLQTPSFNAIIVRYLFIGAIILMLGGLGWGIYIANSFLSEEMVKTDHARIDAEIAQDEIVQLQQLKARLAKDKPTIDKVAQIVAESKQYQFQDQVMSDLTQYAAQTGVQIVGFDFGAKPGTPVANKPGQAAPAGYTRTEVSIQLANDVPYANLLRFVKSIEQNITKIQISDIRLQPNAADPQLVVGPTIKLEVFLR